MNYYDQTEQYADRYDYEDEDEAPEDTRGFRVEVITTTVSVRYVRGELAAEEYAYNVSAYRDRFAETVEAIVRPCPHDSGGVETSPLVKGGLARILRYTCDDCGECYRVSVEHDAVMVRRDPFYAPRTIHHYYDTWTDGQTDDHHRLAHV